MRMLSKIFRTVIALAVFAVFIVCINFVQNEMNKIKKDNELTDTDIVHNAPPVVAFVTVALGSFRGLAADILWLRASMLQEKGQYFEMVQIASLLTKLQPRFTGAISYLAWNMAYNISVVFSKPEDRWRWVKKGLELIRDEAIEYNPSDPILYKELGWIYQHKIGNIMDDANLYYKQQMALDYMKVFGSPQPDWDKITGAPEKLEEFMGEYPKNDAIWKAMELSGFNDFQEFERNFREIGFFSQKFTDELKDPARQSALEWFLRKKWLKEIYKLDPLKMVQINNAYGKLDWRLPEAHAIYWATIGLEKSKLSEREISNDRMITQSLKDAFMSGRLLVINRNDYMSVMTIPNLDLVDTVIRMFKEAYEIHKAKTFKDAAMKNFMVDAIVMTYSFGRYSKAEELLKDMRKEFPEDEKLNESLDIFVEKEWKEDLGGATMSQARAMVSSMIYRSYYYLAYGELEAASAHMKLAVKVYSYYRKDKEGTWERTGMPRFSELKKDMLDACLRSFPPDMGKGLAMEVQKMENSSKEVKEIEQHEKEN